MQFSQNDIGDDILYIADIIETLKEIEEDNLKDKEFIQSILDELKGFGGDYRYEGDWYPQILILDDYFEDYAKDLAESLGLTDYNVSWPNNHINWKEASLDLQQDYISIDIEDFNGKLVTYWYLAC